MRASALRMLSFFIVPQRPAEGEKGGRTPDDILCGKMGEAEEKMQGFHDQME